MPLHKSSRGRLDPTMISAPLGDFRHTMHIGRGGDAFGDTSFLSTQGMATADASNSTPSSVEGASGSEALLTNDTQGGCCNSANRPELQHSESVSSFDLDLDLGPSILGDVLGVMDGLSMDSNWTTGKNGEEGEALSPSWGTHEKDGAPVFSTANSKNNMNERRRMEGADGGENGEREDQLNEGNGWKVKGIKHKVRFSEKREEIIGQSAGESNGLAGEEIESPSSTDGGYMGTSVVVVAEQNSVSGDLELMNDRAESPPSSTSSLSSEYEGVPPLDRRGEGEQEHTETDSEEDEEVGVNGQRGYTFEDEFDDEIGL